MKRILALVLAASIMLPMAAFNAAAVTTTDIDKKGKVNTDLHFTASDFTDACAGIAAPLKYITAVTLPATASGILKLDKTAVDAGDDISAADLGKLVFAPATNFTGVASFTWNATDSAGKSAPPSYVHMDFTVDRPVAYNETLRLIVNTRIDDKFNAADPQDLPLTYAIVTGPVHGDITFSVSKGTFTYTPDKDFVGTDTVTFTVSNGFMTSLPATVTFITANVTAPLAEDTKAEVEMGKSVTGQLSAADTNEPPQDLTYTIIANPSKGTITSFDKATGEFTYHHNTDRLVRDTFTFKVNNGYLDSNAATVTVEIKTPAPLAYRDMRTHWGLKSAGTLAVLDLTIGEQIQDMYYYHPDRTVTRAEYALFLNSIMGVPLSSNTSASVFADVTESYMIASLNASHEHGISSGTTVGGKTYFYPDRRITRIEAMKMLDNAMKFTHENTQLLTFSDKHLIPDWATQSVKNLVGYRIVSGSGGHLRPLDPLTRAEAAQMLFLAYLEHKS